MLNFVFLTDSFYLDYSDCKEIEKKPTRPHAQISVSVFGQIFCIPFRSQITHNYAIFTDKKNRKGLDFSKAVVITDPAKYIVTGNRPYIRPAEFAVIKDVSEYEIEKRLLGYIEKYKRAKSNPTMTRNALILKYSTLQYFEKYIGL